MSAPRVAVIVGSAVGLWAEHDRSVNLLGAVGARAVYVAVNEAGIYHPDPLHHWCSLHPDQWDRPGFEWAARREEQGLRGGYTRWTLSELDYADRTIGTWRRGSSGLLAVDAALNGVGCDLAVLCGMPLDGRPNAFTGKPWEAYERFREGWETHHAKLEHRVRSWAGWTRELLGSPTRAWLEERSALLPV